MVANLDLRFGSWVYDEESLMKMLMVEYSRFWISVVAERKRRLEGKEKED